MITEIFVFFLGILAGTFTGLIPGIHTNLIAIILLASTPLLFTNTPILLFIIFITSMTLTHTFLDFIPSIYFGVPDESTALSVLPGHRYLLKGKAHEAATLTAKGSLLAIPLFVLIIPIFYFALPTISPIVQRMMSWILILISIFLISKEKEKLLTILIFILAGFLGIATLNSNISQPLLPMLSGLFGASTILNSISTQTKIPKQNQEIKKTKRKTFFLPLLATALVSPFCSFLPGLGSSQAAIIGSTITKQKSQKQFLILVGSINTLVLSVSFLTAFLIQKSRTGAADAIQQITTLGFPEFKIIAITILATSPIAYILATQISKATSKRIHKLNYRKISITIFLFLTLIVFIFTQLHGILIFTISTLLGLLTIQLNVKRSFLMGSLLIPITLYYLPFI